MRWHRPLLLLALLPACSRSGLDDACVPVAGVVTGDERVGLAAVGAQRVYWFRLGPSSLALRSAPRCQGSGEGVVEVTREPAWRAVAVVDERLFFLTAEGDLRFILPTRGPSELVAKGVTPLALLARPRELFWLEEDGFHVLPLGLQAQPPSALGPDGFDRLGRPLAFQADDEAIYWLAASADERGAALFRMSRSDRSVAMLVPAGLAPGSPASALALDGGELFYTGLGGQVLEVPVRGGTPRLLASYESPESLAVTAGGLWWRNASGTPGAGLRRQARAGGAVTTVAAPAGSGNPLADLDAVWVDDGRDLHRIADPSD